MQICFLGPAPIEGRLLWISVHRGQPQLPCALSYKTITRWSRCCFWNHCTSPLLTSLRQTPIRVFKTIPSQRRHVDSTKSSTLFHLTPGVQPASCWFRCQVVTPDTADHLLRHPAASFIRIQDAKPSGFPSHLSGCSPGTPLLLPPLLPSLQSPGLCPLAVTSSRLKLMAPSVHPQPGPLPILGLRIPLPSPHPLPNRLPRLHGAEEWNPRLPCPSALAGLLSQLLQHRPPIAQAPECGFISKSCPSALRVVS